MAVIVFGDRFSKEKQQKGKYIIIIIVIIVIAFPTQTIKKEKVKTIFG